MNLLNIEKEKIEIYKNYHKIGELSWTKENLTQVFIQLKTNFSSRFRILLSDQFISITSLLVTKKESKKRQLIQTKAQLIINQKLDQTVWDYKVVANQGKLKLVQIIYVDKNFFDQLRFAVYSAKIKIKLVESLSTSICRFLSKNKLVFLLYPNLIVISFNRTPIYSKILDKKLTQADIEEVFTYTKDRFKILPQQIIFSPTGDTAFSPYDFSTLTPEYIDINPISGLIHSENISGPDEATSRLEIKNSSPVVYDQSFLVKKIIIILSLLIFIVLLIIGGKILFLPSSDQINPKASILPTSTPIAIPTINFDSLKIQVLNGSGISGEAAKITNLLSQNKFKVAKTGNASNYDYIKTEIQVKDSVLPHIIDLLTKSISSDYTFEVSSTKLSQTSEYDIVIISGKSITP
jgi:hypothetical protein